MAWTAEDERELAALAKQVRAETRAAMARLQGMTGEDGEWRSPEDAAAMRLALEAVAAKAQRARRMADRRAGLATPDPRRRSARERFSAGDAVA